MVKKRYLTDTHCWLWWHINPEKLGRSGYKLIENGENEILFSVVSAWEITIKFGLKKLELPQLPEKYIPTRLAKSYMEVLPIQLEHSLRVERLASHHKDPFDRLIVAQAQTEKLVVITCDPMISRYGVETVC